MGKGKTRFSARVELLEDSWGLIRPMAIATATLISWLDYYGIPFRVLSGRRSFARQAELYYTRRGVKAGVPVARPGSSRHEKGEAIDAEFPYGRAAAVAYLAHAAGLKWAGWSDPPHFSLRLR